jgi:hypothetical protein
VTWCSRYISLTSNVNFLIPSQESGMHWFYRLPTWIPVWLNSEYLGIYFQGLKIPFSRMSLVIIFAFLVVLGFEFHVSHLLGRCPATWAIPSALRITLQIKLIFNCCPLIWLILPAACLTCLRKWAALRERMEFCFQEAMI